MTTDSLQPSQRCSSNFYSSIFSSTTPSFCFSVYLHRKDTIMTEPFPHAVTLGNPMRLGLCMYMHAVCVLQSPCQGHCKAPILTVSSPLCVLIDLQVENELWTADSTPSLTDLTCRSITVLILIPLTRCVWDSKDMSAHYSAIVSVVLFVSFYCSAFPCSPHYLLQIVLM